MFWMIRCFVKELVGVCGFEVDLCVQAVGLFEGLTFVDGDIQEIDGLGVYGGLEFNRVHMAV